MIYSNKYRFLWLYIVITLLAFISASAELRNDSFNTLPDSNVANFRTQGRTYWRHEDAQRAGTYLPHYVASGGYHGTASSLTSSVMLVEAYTPERISQTSASITYTTSTINICWTIVSSQDTTIASWTRVGSTAYYFQCQGEGATTAIQPTLPDNSAWLLQVTITAGAITSVSDIAVRIIVGNEVITISKTVGEAGIWIVEPGGTITRNAGTTLTFGGQFFAPFLRQVFLGTGTVVWGPFHHTIIIYPQWFPGSDTAVQINAAIQAGCNNGVGFGCIIDARGYTDTVYVATSVILNRPSVTLLLGPVSYRATATTSNNAIFDVTANGVRLIGCGGAVTLNGTVGGCTIIQDNTNNTSTDTLRLQGADVNTPVTDGYFGHMVMTRGAGLSSRHGINLAYTNGNTFENLHITSHKTDNASAIRLQLRNYFNKFSNMTLPSNGYGIIIELDVGSSSNGSNYFSNITAGLNISGIRLDGGYNNHFRDIDTEANSSYCIDTTVNAEYNTFMDIHCEGTSGSGGVRVNGTNNVFRGGVVANAVGAGDLSYGMLVSGNDTHISDMNFLQNATGSIKVASGATNTIIYPSTKGIPNDPSYVTDLGTRTSVVGEWITPTFNAGDFVGAGALTWTVQAGDVITYEWSLLNKTMTVRFFLQATSTGGVANGQLTMRVPGGATIAKSSVSTITTYDNGIERLGYISADANGTFFNLYTGTYWGATNWSATSANNTAMSGQITFEIQ